MLIKMLTLIKISIEMKIKYRIFSEKLCDLEINVKSLDEIPITDLSKRMLGKHKTVDPKINFNSPNTPDGKPNRIIVPIMKDGKVVSYDIVKRVRIKKPFVGVLSPHKFVY